jgi:hypothetical protein
VGAQPAPRTGWLYQLPPWRAPRRRHHHHHHIGIVEALALMMGMSLYALFFFEIWMFEAMIWATIWFYYGLFLGARWVWRNNPVGRTIDSAHDVTERSRPRPYDPHGAPSQPVDLGQLGDMRRRS